MSKSPSQRRPHGGQTVLHSPSSRRTAQPPRPAQRPIVLAVLHADGFLQLFAEPKNAVAVRVVNTLAVADTEAILAERYIDATLPAVWKTVYIPRNLVAMGHVKDCRTATAELSRRQDLYFVRTLAGK